MHVQRSLQHSLVAFLAVSALASGASEASAQGSIGSTRWSFSGGDLTNTRNAKAETRINPANVGGLIKKWELVTSGDVSATPTVEKQGNQTVVYAVDWGVGAGGNIYALNGNDGSIRWSQPVASYTGNPLGSTSRTSPAISGNTLVIGDQGDLDYIGFPKGSGNTASITAIDKNTGALLWRTVVSDHPFSTVTSSPVIYNGVVYVGVASLEENAGFIPGYPFSFRGKVVAVDLKTGRVRWETSTIDEQSYRDGYTGAAVWGSTPVVDADRNSLYVATGNNYTSPSGTGNVTGAVTPAGNMIDAVISLDLRNGSIKWVYRSQPADTWDVARWVATFNPFNPPDALLGPDYDFGSGPNLITLANGDQFVGAGAKSGIYHLLNPRTGAAVWQTQVGPGGTGGGIEWGSASDGRRVYVAIANSNDKPNDVGTTGGLWSALDARTGQRLWATADPIQVTQTATDPATGFQFPLTRYGHDFGAVTIANGVMFAGSTGGAPIPSLGVPGYPGAFFALDAATGAILWQFASDGAVNSGPAVVDGTVYWGSGYSHLGNAFGLSGSPRLIAFSLP